MRKRFLWASLFTATVLSGGCTALCDSVPNAIPVRRLPDEVLHSPSCGGTGCDAAVRVNRPANANPRETIVRTKYETKADGAPPSSDSPPPPPTSDSPPFVPVAGAGCGPCAVFYTGGKLGSGMYVLKPDMRVTEAIAEAHGPISPGCFHKSATRVTVLRRLCTGQQLAIRVDLKEALIDPRENIPVWPGDTILTH